MKPIYFLPLFLLLSNIAGIFSSIVNCVWSSDYNNGTVKNLSTTIKDTCPYGTTGFRIEGELHKFSNNFISGVDKLKWITAVNVSLQTIEVETFENFPQLSNLQLQDNQLTVIKSGTFNNLQKLYSINLQNNSISVLETGAFKNLPELNNLRLDMNRLTEIKKGVFENITLTTVELNKNRLSKIEDGAFSGVRTHGWTGSYLVINLEDNKLQEFNSAVFKNPTVTELNLAKNKISLLQGNLENLPELEKLSLSDNKLEEIPEGVFNGSKLKDLDLSHNQISTIARAAFNDMSDLQKIILDYNKLSLWNSDWFQGSTQLTHISASYNFLKNIPEDAFKNVPRCKHIELVSNQIGNIPSDTFKGLNLTWLNLINNKLEEWGEDLRKNAKVSVFLGLSGNKIPCPEEGPKFLSADAHVLIDNCLKQWDSNWFYGCLKLTRFYVTNIATQKIPEDAFKNVLLLQALDLSTNHIKAITTNPFKNRFCVNLIMKDNKLEEWGEDFKDEIKISRFLDLRGNKIPCPEGGFKSFSSARDVLSSCD